MAILTIVMVYWAVNSYEQHETYGFEIKVTAVEKMESAINLLREEFINRGINNGKDSLAFGSFLLGPQRSIIQTTRGSRDSKLSTLNPDFAAMITEMLIELELDSSSKVAVSYTGSYPGGNIAVLSALEAMNIEASIISSCGSSSFGATNPEMTWIDMENILFNKIFSNKSGMASIGGGNDLGSQMGNEGIVICEKSISNLEVIPIFEKNREYNINQRLSFFNNGSKPELLINVGGGIFTMGDSLTRNMIPYGIIYPHDLEFDLTNSIASKVLLTMPLININHIKDLTFIYNLPFPPNIDTKPRNGTLFYIKTEYNRKIILTAFLISLLSVLWIGIISHNEINKRMHSSEPESIL
ncbi:MAG: poly-gamma-glutamate system protein [Candidatus Marinimicrobia bacterium]|nr:poly-gamma-glutamate system protein [Candidatus Neomarinimicrobiota bacterium]